MELTLWNLTNGSQITGLSEFPIETFGELSSRVKVFFGSDGSILTLVSNGGELGYWEAFNSELRYKLLMSGVASVAFPSAEQLAISTEDFPLKIFEFEDIENSLSSDTNTTLNLSIFDNVSFRQLSFSNSGTLLAGISGDTVVLGDLNAMDEVRSNSANELNELLLTSNIDILKISPDGQSLIIAADSGLLGRWDIEQRKFLNFYDSTSELITAISFAPDGQLVSTWNQLGIVNLWDIDSGKKLFSTRPELSTPLAESEPSPALAFSPLGDTIALSRGGSIHLLNLEGELVSSIGSELGSIFSLAYSQNGKMIASAHIDRSSTATDPSPGIIVWDVASGARIRTFLNLEDDSDVYGVEFSPDGSRIAAGLENDTLKVWDMLTGLEIHTFEGHSEDVGDIRFTQDGNIIASVSADGTVKIWDLNEQTLIRSIDNHNDESWRLAITNNGETLVDSDSNGNPRTLDLATGRPLRTFLGQAETIVSDVSHDGRIVASGHSDGTLSLWWAEQESRSDETQTQLPVSNTVTLDGSSIATSSIEMPITSTFAMEFDYVPNAFERLIEFELAAAGNFIVQANTIDDLDLVATLYHATDTDIPNYDLPIDSNDDTNGLDPQIDAYLEPGRYYLRVTEYDEREIGRFQFMISPDASIAPN